MDAWLKTDAGIPAQPDAVYAGVLGLLSIKMRVTVIWTDGPDPLAWRMSAIRHSGFTSRLLDINKLFADCRLGEFKDQAYMRNSVIPGLTSVLQSQRPAMEFVKTKLVGINIGYDRILAPQKNTGTPEWILSSSYGHFMLGPTVSRDRLDIDDEAIIQLLIEGLTAKEIAASLALSHRTIEHRLDRMKQRYGARNVVHLTAMLIANHLDLLSAGAGGLQAVDTAPVD